MEDMIQVILHADGLDETLSNVVRLVSSRMNSEVCSIYLLEQGELLLRATEGLAPETVMRTRLQVGEGLIGFTAESGTVINLRDPETHPRFRFIAGSNEERFHSFLGIPLYDRSNLLGVMAIQTESARLFTKKEVSTLRAIAFQVSTVIVNARLLDSIDDNSDLGDAQTDPITSEPFLSGTSQSTGVTVAEAYLYDDLEELPTAPTASKDDFDPSEEERRLEVAIEKAKLDTLCLQRLVTEQLTDQDGQIFQTHLMILQDQQFLSKLRRSIESGHSASRAIRLVVTEYQMAFDKLSDPYLRSRKLDIEDVGRRIQLVLNGGQATSITLSKPSIIIAKDLLPSQLAILPFDKVAGFVLESEHTTSHAAIIAKSMGIPTLFGSRDATRRIGTGDQCILDANSERLYVNPEPNILMEYERLLHEQTLNANALKTFLEQPATTRDGHRVTLRANLGLLSDLAIAKSYNAEGIGLYRTEFPFMCRSEFPTRDEQYQLYRKVVETFPDHPVTFRTLDIGGDKSLPYFSNPREDNPFLGCRSVRVSLENPDRFQTQIEAILMASAHGCAKVMFPMVTSVSELEECVSIVNRAKDQLTSESLHFRDIPLGVMVETPATITIAPHLAERVDFFALGTNDLIQYLLAADRGNSRVRRYYDPLHPGVLDAIARMIQIAKDANRELCICGDIAGEFETFALLVGMGMKSFSLAAPTMSRMKSKLRVFSYKQLRDLASAVLEMADSQEIRSHLRTTIG